MTSTELSVVICCLLLGYVLVKKMLGRTDEDGKTSQKSDGNSQAKPDPPRTREEVARGQWFRVLAVSEYASYEEIVRAYKAQISQYHPDKVEQMGAEIRELAESKSKQINAAFEYATKLRRD